MAVSTAAMNKYFVAAALLLSVCVINICIRWFSVVQSPKEYPQPRSRRHCSLKKRHPAKLAPSSATPPWFSLLADYSATVSSGRNLYLWPRPENVDSLRLGNRLFNYAATFGIAWHNRRIPIWPHSRRTSAQYDISKFFNLRIQPDENMTVIKSSMTQAVNLLAKGSAVYDEKFDQLPERNVSIDSIFASYKYFRDVESELRTDLTFKPSILAAARQWLEEQTPEKWKDKEFVHVVIHVRRTDYHTRYHERDGWPMPTADYFRRSMKYFTDCLERVQFVVLSDDPEWCRANIKGTDVVYSRGHSPIVDMAIASLCNHTIMTIGTYGWWLAWFANGVTITQKDIPKKGSPLSRRLSRADHYKPDWIGL